ncbi:unnamed protein product [Camellia sinensis]
MDTGIYGDKLRLLILLIRFEVGFGDFTATTQLPVGGVGYRKGLRVVFRDVSLVFPFVGCHVHHCFHRSHWLWFSMACHLETHHLALFPGYINLIRYKHQEAEEALALCQQQQQMPHLLAQCQTVMLAKSHHCNISTSAQYSCASMVI